MAIEVSPQNAEFVSYGTPSYDDAPTAPQVVEAEQPPTVEKPAEESTTTPNDGVVTTPAPNAEVVTTQDVADEKQENDQERVFREMFEKTFGMAPEAFKNELETQRQEKERAAAERELERLKDTWGTKDDTVVAQRLELIQKRLEALPEASRQALNNYEGINLIWNALVAEQGNTSIQFPRYEKDSVVTPAQQRPMFTRDQLRAMSPDEYRRRNDEILYAYQNNLVQ